MPKVKKLRPISSLKGVKTINQLLSTPRRWVKGAYITTDGTKVCLVGAVNAIYNSDKNTEVRNKLRKSITNFYKSRSGQAKNKDIESFNDARTRTFADIRWVIQDAKV